MSIGRSPRSGLAGGVAALLALLLVPGAPGDDRSTDDDAFRDCPGRRADDDALVPAHDPPALVPIRIGPYGQVLGYLPQSRLDVGPPPAARAGYRRRVFHVADCPHDPVGDRFVGLDRLVTVMGERGLKLYRSPAVTIDAGPDGIIARDDVVVIKINYQWSQRGGTNMDVVRGLIKRIVDHPRAFTGEIVICENAQFASVSGFDRSQNNAQDTSLSPHDVVTGFQVLGVDVSHYDWTAIRSAEVDEYSAGDADDGYVLFPYDAQLNGHVSYPKFRTDSGTMISLKHGIWNAKDGTYDRDRLVFINVPVLKSHGAVYGVTACVKNYMGVVTGYLGTNSHNAISNGMMGAVLSEIGLADLNILDCIWVNADPDTGPSTSYAGARRHDELVASIDPVAADIWATVNILIPAFLDSGHTPPWPYPSADPDDPDGAFRNYLDHSMDCLLAAGLDVTNDLDRIDAFTWSAADDCPPDVNGDGRIGLRDVLTVIASWGPCDGCVVDVDGDGAVGGLDLLSVLAAWGPCPKRPTATIPDDRRPVE